MSTIKFNDQLIEVPDSGTVLDTLLRNGFDIPYSCKSGVCQSCLMRATAGAIPESAQSDLKDALVAQGYFKACSCKPETNMTIELPDEAALFIPAKIESKRLMAKDILQLILIPWSKLPYRAGQFINLHRQDGISRSYSLSNLPQDDHLIELHIKRVDNGVMSTWLFDEVEPGQRVDIQGPIGHCFYTSPVNQKRNILLIGTGTGLAPLIGIVKDALANRHTGEIYLYHGSRSLDGLYKHKELCELEAQHENLHYYPCCSREPPQFKDGHEILIGRASDIALSQHQKLTDWLVYVCGHADMVRKTEKLAYLAGARIIDIYADPFSFNEVKKQTG